jgi:hypothetical protein
MEGQITVPSLTEEIFANARALTAAEKAKESASAIGKVVIDARIATNKASGRSRDEGEQPVSPIRQVLAKARADANKKTTKATTGTQQWGRAARAGKIDPVKAMELQAQHPLVRPTPAQILAESGGRSPTVLDVIKAARKANQN